MKLSAQLAGWYWGLSPISQSGGWLLRFDELDILISPACSGFSFFVILNSLLLWLIIRDGQPRILPLGLFLVLILTPVLSIGFNATRILVSAEFFTLIHSFASPSWLPRFHLLAGIITFLPALTITFLLTRKAIHRAY